MSCRQLAPSLAVARQPRRSRRVGRRELGRAVHPAPPAGTSSGSARDTADRAQHPHQLASLRRRARGGCSVGRRVRDGQRGDGQPPAVVRRPGPCCVAGREGTVSELVRTTCRWPQPAAKAWGSASSTTRRPSCTTAWAGTRKPWRRPSEGPGTRRSSASPRGRPRFRLCAGDLATWAFGCGAGEGNRTPSVSLGKRLEAYSAERIRTYPQVSAVVD